MVFIKHLIIKLLIKLSPLYLKLFARILTLLPDEMTYPVFSQYNFHFLKKHYYLPIPDAEDLEFANYKTDMIGIDIDEHIAFDLLDTVILPYKTEFAQFPPYAPTEKSLFYIANGSFMAGDGHAYYAFIRHYKPRKVVEIGSGNSTLLAAAAIRKNDEEGHNKTELICIEPYPRPMLRQAIPQISQLIEKKVQAIDLAFFEQLKAGDILFIDSTHVLRPGGDVWWEYCEILPRLQSGVLVHIHDIGLPQAYPSVYFDRHWYWQEQSVLQAFLSFNTRYEIILPFAYLVSKYHSRMREMLSPEWQIMQEKYPGAAPGSMWLRVR